MPILTVFPPAPVIIAQNVAATQPSALPVPSDALLESTLTEAARLAAQTSEKRNERAQALCAVADVYAAANRPTEAKRLYSAAAAAIQLSGGSGGSDTSLLRSIARGQVNIRDDAEAMKTAGRSADPTQKREVAFLIARRDAPADSLLRKEREEDAFQPWFLQQPEEKDNAATPYQQAIEQYEKQMTSVLEDQSAKPDKRVGALLLLMARQPEKRGELAGRYLIPLAENIRKISDPEARVLPLTSLAQVHYLLGDDKAVQMALSESLESLAQIPDPQVRFHKTRGWIISTRKDWLQAFGSSPEPMLPPWAVPDALRARVDTITQSTLTTLRQDTAQSKPGDTPEETVKRLITAAVYADSFGYPTPPAEALRYVDAGIAQVRKLPPDSRDAFLSRLIEIQDKAGVLDAAVATMHLSEDHLFRVRTLLNLAGGISLRSLPPAQRIPKMIALRDAALTEARRFPAGPERYRALVWIQAFCKGGTVEGQSIQVPGLFQEIVSLLPPGTIPLIYYPDGIRSAQEPNTWFLLRLAYLGQHVGDHQTVKKLLQRLSTLALKTQVDSYVSEDMLDHVARAQAFSGDYVGAKNTLLAALKNVSRIRVTPTARPVFIQDTGYSRSKAAFAVSQAAVRDFSGALATARTISPLSAGIRSRALSAIAQEIINARNGKPVEQPRVYEQS